MSDVELVAPLEAIAPGTTVCERFGCDTEALECDGLGFISLSSDCFQDYIAKFYQLQGLDCFLPATCQQYFEEETSIDVFLWEDAVERTCANSICTSNTELVANLALVSENAGETTCANYNPPPSGCASDVESCSVSVF